MRISSADFRTQDIYIDYPFEKARFCWEREAGRKFRHFYGEPEVELFGPSELFSQAIISDREITREEYYGL